MRAANTMCQRYYCDHMGDRICCANCEKYHKCKNPCINDPRKCGYSEKRKEIFIVRAEVKG